MLDFGIMMISGVFWSSQKSFMVLVKDLPLVRADHLVTLRVYLIIVITIVGHG